MKNITIEIQYPMIDHKDCTANIGIDKQNIVNDKRVTIKEIGADINNPLYVVLDNQSGPALLKLKAGDYYPNSMLGDLILEIAPGTSVIPVEVSRFVTTEDTIELGFIEDDDHKLFKGTIYAMAKWNGITVIE